MSTLSIHPVTENERKLIEQIAIWYETEWNIPQAHTLKRMNHFAEGKIVFQLLLKTNDRPIATGGIYSHVGLIDKEPRLGIHRHWLALMYTVPDMRGKGIGAALCREIIATARHKDIKEIQLFTDTAENLYAREGWQVTERLEIGQRKIAVMQLSL
ncbi:MAG: GNAT family N-acetyltransferase [Bacteroidia bacterium]|jgi:GNAT superfamily N-acetyltransferase|nr:GNAT family N-acetyltransferase [Bacteroidia bacterium]